MSDANGKTSTPTVGLLYAGELGAALGSVLRARGFRVISTLRGRGRATADRCHRAGLIIVETPSDVVRESDIVFSLVPPSAAQEVAALYCELAGVAPRTAIYVDANSISPEQSSAIGAEIERAGRGFVDAAINGLARNLTSSATLFLSGGRAGDVAELFGSVVRVQVLGVEPGRASAMKMLLSGLSKGICALFAELAVVADRRGMLGEFSKASSQIYPGIWALVERMLPTYAQHAHRRAAEMQELEETASASGVEPCLVSSILKMHELLASVQYDASATSVESLVRQLVENEFLTADPSAAGEAKSRSAV